MMDLFDRINCIIGDSFFFKIFEKEIEDILMKQYNITKIYKEFVYDNASISKLNTALLPNIFDIEPKLIVLRDLKGSLISKAINSLKNSHNVFLLIEIEADQYDKRVKIFKELEQKGCITNAGLAFCDNKQNTINLAFNKIEKINGCVIDPKAKEFIKNNIEKKEYQNKPVYNLNRIYNEIKKMLYIDKNINLDLCKKSLSLQSKYCNIFDITNALSDNNLELALDIIDNKVSDATEARYLLSLIMSEVKIICSVSGHADDNFDILYNQINKEEFKFVMAEDATQKIGENKKLHPYRLRKILEKKETEYFNNCNDNLKLCIEAHNDLNYYYSNNPKIPLIKLCYKICSI